jgi:hypothetical protein
MEELASAVLAFLLLIVLGKYLHYRHDKWKIDAYTKGWKYASSSIREKKETHATLSDNVRLAKEMGIFTEYHRGIENYLSIIPPFSRLKDENIVP